MSAEVCADCGCDVAHEVNVHLCEGCHAGGESLDIAMRALVALERRAAEAAKALHDLALANAPGTTVYAAGVGDAAGMLMNYTVIEVHGEARRRWVDGLIGRAQTGESSPEGERVSALWYEDKRMHARLAEERAAVATALRRIEGHARRRAEVGA